MILHYKHELKKARKQNVYNYYIKMIKHHIGLLDNLNKSCGNGLYANKSENSTC